MTSLYAGICLLDVPHALDRVFDYTVPDTLRDAVSVGSFVSVPFGRSNRVQSGIVLSLSDVTEAKGLKAIRAVAPTRPLDDEQLGLVTFLKEQTLCTTGDAVRAMVPARLTDAEKPSAVRETRYCRLAIDIEEAAALAESLPGAKLRCGSEGQRTLLKSFLAHGGAERRIEEKELLRYSGGSRAQIESLVRRGILSTESEVAWRGVYDGEGEDEMEEIHLSEEQDAAYRSLLELYSSGKPCGALLHGVTGSGKTSVMLKLIDDVLSDLRGVIVLLPEISLTPQTIGIFCSRFGNRVAVVHSGLSHGERCDAYRRIESGEADLVIGTRSAVFAPVKRLGLIVIDEEQEHTYKSDMNPKYHARDVARFRSAYHHSLLLLASATPALESYKKALEGKYTLLSLKNRYGKARLPSVEVVDMRREGSDNPFSASLAKLLAETYAREEQSILFLNRRGYNHFLSCRSCGKVVECERCSVSMTYHTTTAGYDKGVLVCHLCGARRSVPEVCPECSSPHLARLGYGTQRVEQEIGTAFPRMRILRMDTDTTGTRESYDRILGAFRHREADLLLGTQMVTKGHDFPDVTLVGVMNADSSLYLDDYRAAERTFSMLTQVIGRAGRGSKPGVAVIQTMNPDSDVIALAKAQDYEAFYEREIRLRKALLFPPFVDIVLLTLSGENEQALMRASLSLRENLESLTAGEFSSVPILLFGPFEAPIYRVDRRYRMRIVVKCRLNRDSRALFGRILDLFEENHHPDAPQLSVDFNPSSL